MLASIPPDHSPARGKGQCQGGWVAIGNIQMLKCSLAS